ncbi:phage antirepressor KilAC domain-containing protein [Comamonas testosteroni]|uniref:phage antirepressor KilAC domain-containing protein n=1 Tax=Comamonas testosteroni TaxID=285 RepID=UPI0009BCAB0B|nr:phage antirepressor KilAC domain-containing protein [Comamonas testosteroni]
MTSLELVDFINEDRKARAEAVGAQFPSPGFAKLEHKDFLAKVPQVLGLDTSEKFSADLPDSYGRSRRGYRFPKREACLMAMSYSYELQAKVFDRMTALEQCGQAPKIDSHEGALLALQQLTVQQLALIQENKRTAAELALAAPKAEYVDRYVAANGSMGFRQVAKLLNAKEPEFRAFLEDSKILYRLAGVLTPYQNHIEAGRFSIKTGVSQVSEHAFAHARFTPKGVQWIAGLWSQHQVRLKQSGEVTA